MDKVIRQVPRECHHRGEHNGGRELMVSKYKENQKTMGE